MGDSVRFEKRRFNGAEFLDCAMANTVFDNIDFADARFTNVNMSGVRIDNANLRNVAIQNANVEGLTIYGYDIHALLQPLLERDAMGKRCE